MKTEKVSLEYHGLNIYNKVCTGSVGVIANDEKKIRDCIMNEIKKRYNKHKLPDEGVTQVTVNDNTRVKNVFISLGLHGKTPQEIAISLIDAIEDIESMLGYSNFDVTHNTFCHGPESSGRLYYLGEAVKKMDKVDAIYFASGWKQHSGCIVEHAVAELYGIRILG